MTSISQYAANQGVPAVRKWFTRALAASRSTATVGLGSRNCACVAVKVTVSTLSGTGITETIKLQYFVPGGAAAVDMTAATAITYTNNNVATTDIPLTVNAIPSGAILQIIDTVSGGTATDTIFQVDVIEDDGRGGT